MPIKTPVNDCQRHAALSTLYADGILRDPPAGSELDDEAFEPGALAENNALFVKLLEGHDGWNMLDVHSGLYMLGTRDTHSTRLYSGTKR
jgi:hypothetical protein